VQSAVLHLFTIMFGQIESWLRERFGLEPNASQLNAAGMQLCGQGRTAEAIAQFQQAIAAAPYFTSAWINLAGCRALLGEHAAAVEAYTRAIELDPRVAVSWNGRGLSHLAIAQFAAAHADFEQALALDPTITDFLQNRGVAAMCAGWPDRALADLNVVIAREPARAAAWLQRGLALSALGRTSEAVVEMERATQLDPADAAAWRELGTLHYFRGELPAAVATLTRGLAIVPGEALAANNRGAAQFLLGRFAEAEADFQSTIAAQPHFPSSKKNLAWLRATCPNGRFRSGSEAVSLAREALDMVHWDQPAWLEVLAAAYAEAGDFASATQWQRKAREELPADSQGIAGKRLALYESQLPFRIAIEPGQPPELIPGSRLVALQEIISRA
jgi:tetratricopeptide (TPR) repeat protein